MLIENIVHDVIMAQESGKKQSEFRSHPVKSHVKWNDEACKGWPTNKLPYFNEKVYNNVLYGSCNWCDYSWKI
jgi:hypothetical protein